MAQSINQYSRGSIVALCRPTQPLKVIAKIGNTNCNVMLDSGSSLSLISDTIFRRVKNVS